MAGEPQIKFYPRHKNAAPILFIVPVPGGRHRYCIDDDHLGARAGDRLQQALHVPRHIYHDQETSQAEARSLQLPQPFVEGNLGKFVLYTY